MAKQHDSRTAGIRAAALRGDGAAEAMLATLLQDLFALEARNVVINRDQYSLNSLNGFFDTAQGAFFFKFHQEEGEEAMSGEYYRADILARAGLPVDQPLHVSAEPGEQILVYRRRGDPRFSDVLRALDMDDDPVLRARAGAAEAALGRTVMEVYARSLHSITAAQAGAEPINRLFRERLVDPATGIFPGGRLAAFYVGQTFVFPGVSLEWEQFSTARFIVNGVAYDRTVGALFDGAQTLLQAPALARGGGVVAHGDAHNANVWYEATPDGARLSFFDPAFAGENVPSLLAEVKTTFHNILAHPFWLYDPAEAARRFTAQGSYEDGALVVATNWELSPVRRDLLDIKADTVWRPLLARLKAQGLLPDDWRRTVRHALFLCPTLVMNLRAGVGRHNPVSSLIGFATAVRAGSEPVGAADEISRFLDSVTP